MTKAALNLFKIALFSLFVDTMDWIINMIMNALFSYFMKWITNESNDYQLGKYDAGLNPGPGMDVFVLS